jgi:hypothetical protein
LVAFTVEEGKDGGEAKTPLFLVFYSSFSSALRLFGTCLKYSYLIKKLIEKQQIIYDGVCLSFNLLIILRAKFSKTFFQLRGLSYHGADIVLIAFR